MSTILSTTVILMIWELLVAILLTRVARCGRVGRQLSDILAHAPWLDGVVAALTWVPWVAAALMAGWVAVVTTLIGQIVVFYIWVVAHEAMNRQAVRGPRIVRTLNRIVGRGRNHAALWVSVIGLPALWAIRVTEIVGYYPLVWLLGFPRYRQGDWVNVSRYKFDGLVGHDLIWCLYCDWMTGIWSLGSEILRNVESFWCPIRFDDSKKCENCRWDFPDIDGGWVAADGTMHDVEKTLMQRYADGQRSWFGHPSLITGKGRPLPEPDDPGATDDPGASASKRET